MSIDTEIVLGLAVMLQTVVVWMLTRRVDDLEAYCDELHGVVDGR